MSIIVANDEPMTLLVEQQFVDVVVVVPAHGLRVDSPTGDGGVEMALVPAGKGATEILFETYSPPSGEARIELTALPAPAGQTPAREAWAAVTRAGSIFASNETSLEARRLYLAASGHFKTADLPHLAAHSLYNAAAISRLLEEFELAAELYGEVIRIARATDEIFLLARTHHMRGILSSYRGEPAASMPDFEVAENTYRQLDNQRRVSDVQIDRCRTQADTGRLQEARECLLQLESRLNHVEDYKRLTSTAINLGFVAAQLSRFDEAEAAYGRALDYSEKVNDAFASSSRTRANAYSGRARLRFLRGADRAALVDYLHALRILMPLEAVRLEANVMRGVAAIYARLGYHRLAQAFNSSARVRYEELNVQSGLVATWLRDAQLSADMDDPRGAHHAIAAARRLVTALEDQSLLLGSTVVTEALVCRNLGDFDCMQRAATEAAALRAQGLELPDLDAELALVAATIASHSGKPADTVENASRALQAANPVVRAEAAMLLGETALAADDVDAAAGYFRTARAALQERRGEAPDLLPDQSRLQRRIYRRMVDVLAMQTEAGPGQRVEEALALVQQLAGSARNPVLADPRLQKQRERAAARLASRIETAGDALPVLESLLEIESSLQAAEQRAHDPAVDLDTVRGFLPQQSAMLIYLLGTRSSVGFRIDADTVTAFPVPPRDQILDDAENWRREIQARSPNERTLAARLGHALLPATVCCDATTERLFVYEPGELNHIPFSAMVPAAVDEPLGARSSVVRLVSLVPNAPARNAGTLEFAGIGDPVIDGADPRLPAPTDSEGDLSSFGRLAGSDREWNNFKAGTSVAELTGFSATKSRVLQSDILGADILHIATHAIGDTRYGIGSGFFLSRFDPSGNPMDGFVSSLEILVRSVDARLVVLSACDTAYSESGLNLAESFVRAGAESVIASLWPISNRATQALMDAFYRELDGAPDLATAMQRAQSQLRNTPVWDKSYFWAAFEVYAHPGAI